METKTLYMMEDRVMKTPGLYFMSFCCYVASLACLAADGHDDLDMENRRDFLLYTSLISTLYWSVSTVNTIYGNGKPSTMIMIAGPIHQFTFWLFLAYYRGHVYGKDPAGVLNTVHTALVGAFNLDLFVKTWLLACVPHKYKEYVCDAQEENVEAGGGSGEEVTSL